MPARPLRRLGFGLFLLALVACAPPRMTVVPEPLQGLAPCAAQVDPHLFALTEHWASGGTAGDVPVGVDGKPSKALVGSEPGVW